MKTIIISLCIVLSVATLSAQNKVLYDFKATSGWLGFRSFQSEGKESVGCQYSIQMRTYTAICHP
jgi:hypothetical protein